MFRKIIDYEYGLRQAIPIKSTKHFLSFFLNLKWKGSDMIDISNKTALFL